MEKPVALTNAQLDELALRVTKGWVVHYEQMRALIAMARERNEWAVKYPPMAAGMP